MLHHLCWFNLAERWENNYDLQKYLQFQCLLAFGLWIPSFYFEGDVIPKCLLGFFHSKAAHVQKKNSPKLEWNYWNFKKKELQCLVKAFIKERIQTLLLPGKLVSTSCHGNRMYSNYTRNDVLHLTRCSSPLNGEKLL